LLSDKSATRPHVSQTYILDDKSRSRTNLLRRLRLGIYLYISFWDFVSSSTSLFSSQQLKISRTLPCHGRSRLSISRHWICKRVHCDLRRLRCYPRTSSVSQPWTNYVSSLHGLKISKSFTVFSRFPNHWLAYIFSWKVCAFIRWFYSYSHMSL